MKAYVVESPRKGAVMETEMPTPADDEILVEVKAAGVCGTDVHIYKGDYFGEYPRIPGHEFSGVVKAIGKHVTKYQVGDRVAADPNIFCEGCDACKENKQNFCVDMHAVGVTRHGAFAQYLTVPERCVFPMGDLSFTVAAMVEPLSCAVYAQEKMGIPLGSSVLIIGAGPVGLIHLQLAKMNGAYEVTISDIIESKVAFAKTLGADRAVTSQELEQMGVERSFDVVIDCTGVPEAVEGAVKYVKDAGTLFLFGVCPDNNSININPYEIFKRELTITATYALKKTYGKALRLAQSGQVDLLAVVDRRLELDEVPDLFTELESGNSGLKVIVYPNGIVD